MTDAVERAPAPEMARAFRRAAAVLAIATAALAAPVLVELVAVWLVVPYYSHAWLVPAFSAWLLWDLRQDSPPAPAGVPPVEHARSALVAFLVGTGVLVLGTTTGSLTLRALALPALAFAAALVLVRGATPRRLAFPIGFLALMAPLPESALDRLSLVLQHLAAWVTAGVLATAGIPHVRAGLFIHLEGVTVHVSEACNGLRFLLAMLATGVAFAGLGIARPGLRLLMVALALAVAVVSNLIRVSSTALIAHAWGPDAASGLPHILYGKAVYAVALAAFVAALLAVRRGTAAGAPARPLGPGPGWIRDPRATGSAAARRTRP